MIAPLSSRRKRTFWPRCACAAGPFSFRVHRRNVMATETIVDKRDMATIFAALRYYQERLRYIAEGIQAGLLPDAVFDRIATGEGTFEALDVGEIDTLCERLSP